MKPCGVIFWGGEKSNQSGKRWKKGERGKEGDERSFFGGSGFHCSHRFVHHLEGLEHSVKRKMSTKEGVAIPVTVSQDKSDE